MKFLDMLIVFIGLHNMERGQIHLLLAISHIFLNLAVKGARFRFHNVHAFMKEPLHKNMLVFNWLGQCSLQLYRWPTCQIISWLCICQFKIVIYSSEGIKNYHYLV